MTHDNRIRGYASQLHPLKELFGRGICCCELVKNQEDVIQRMQISVEQSRKRTRKSFSGLWILWAPRPRQKTNSIIYNKVGFLGLLLLHMPRIGRKQRACKAWEEETTTYSPLQIRKWRVFFSPNETNWCHFRDLIYPIESTKPDINIKKYMRFGAG